MELVNKHKRTMHLLFGKQKPGRGENAEKNAEKCGKMRIACISPPCWGLSLRAFLSKKKKEFSMTALVNNLGQSSTAEHQATVIEHPPSNHNLSSHPLRNRQPTSNHRQPPSHGPQPQTPTHSSTAPESCPR